MADSRLAHGPTLVHGDASGPAPTSGAAAAVAPGDELAIGTLVGEYVVDGFLGAGAMGEVYAGTHPVIGKKVAIKVLKRSVAASPDGAERFKREARAAGQVAHPRVVDVFSFGRLDDGRLFLVMDLVTGRSLRKAIAGGPLPVAMALEVLAQIADALDAAHGKGVVHRDLKPDNVMLAGAADNEAPTVFVLDFGLAKLLAGPDGTAAPSMLTGQGTWLGTPSYMAPEQWSADGAGPASDRYALGVMAFELLAGSPPFAAQSLPQMMEQHFRAKVPALSTRGAVGHSAPFDPVLARAMAKDPAARFASAREMVDALRAVAGVTAPRGPGGGKRIAPAIAGAAVLGLSLVAVLSLRGPTPPREPTRAPPAAATPPGTVRIELDSIPRGAEIRQGNLATRTPTYLDVASGQRLVLDIVKPGYATLHREVTAAVGMKLAPFQLEPITGFEGVWMLPSGELRMFHRAVDRVEVSKLAAVNAAPTFFRAYDLVPAADGVTFSSTETIHQPGRPEHPSCYIPYTTEYHYDPRTDELSVRREKILVDVVNDACVRAASEMATPDKLARADRKDGDAIESLAPVGKPVPAPKATKKKKAANFDKRAAPTEPPTAQAPTNPAPPPMKSAIGSKAAPAAQFQDAPSPPVKSTQPVKK